MKLRVHATEPRSRARLMLWVLLPFCPDWRWLTERDDSPWYKTARLFRQSCIADWDGVIAQVAGELAQAARATA